MVGDCGAGCRNLMKAAQKIERHNIPTSASFTDEDSSAEG